MAKIKVICGGCGITYTDEHGAARHALKTAESGPFEYDDQKAARLVSLGVAEYVETGDKPEEKAEKPTGVVGTIDPEFLKDMSLAELKELASEVGADTKGCKSKADYIAAIADVEVTADDDDDLPDLGAADPE